MKGYSLDHINLTVTNLDEALVYYTTYFGLEIMENVEEDGMRFVFLTDQTTIYELIENSGVPHTTINHLAFASNDIKKDYEYFKQQNLTMSSIYTIHCLFEHGLDYFFIKGVNKELIEFCQKRK